MNDNNNCYPMIADLFQLFSRSASWMILYSLRRKVMTLSEISKSLGMTQKAVLPELMALQRKDILVSFNRSQETYYRLADARILQAFDLIHKNSQRKAPDR
jgi:predicted transcriptional regulator